MLGAAGICRLGLSGTGWPTRWTSYAPTLSSRPSSRPERTSAEPPPPRTRPALHPSRYRLRIPPRTRRRARARGRIRTGRTCATSHSTKRGQATAEGTIAYRPGQALSAAVTAQEQYCTFPGCRTPACYTDLDHIEPFKPHQAGTGEPQTRAANLQPLCRSHHNLKTAGLWTTRRQADGTLTRTSARTGPHLPTHPSASRNIDSQNT